MLGRHYLVSCAWALFPAALAAGCATSAANNEHGAIFDGDAGGEGGDDASQDGAGGGGDGSLPPDSGADAGREVGSYAEAMAEASPDAPVDSGSGSDASEGGGGDGGHCPSTMALLATGSSQVAEAIFAAGAWSPATASGTGAAALPARPALVGLAGGYLGALVTGGTLLDWTRYAGTWAAPAQVASALGQGTPSLAVTGATAHLLYWGTNGKYYHGQFTGTSWDGASDPVEVDGGAQSFGSSPAAAAWAGGALVVAQSGTNGVLYQQSWTAGGWQAAAPVAGSSVVPFVGPAIAALTGGTADLMIVFVHGGDGSADYHFQFVTRTAGAWSPPAEVYNQGGNIAFAGTTPSLAALPKGGAILTWQAGAAPANPYASIYDASSKTWSAPQKIASSVLASPPSVVAGVCGATATVAFVQATGEVEVASLAGGAWSAPAAISGASGMQAVALAATP